MQKKASLWAYIKNYKFNSIFIKNFLVVFFLLMVPLLFVHTLVYLFNGATMREEISKASISELTRIRDTVDMIMDEAESLSIRLASDPDVEIFLAADQIQYPMDYLLVSRIRRIQNILGITLLTNPYVDSIRIYSGLNNYLLMESSGGHLDKYEHRWWYDEYLQHKDSRNAWITTLQRGEEDYSIVLFRRLPLHGFRQDSVLTVDIGAQQLAPLLKGTTPDQEIYIVDREGRVVFTENQSFINLQADKIQPEWPTPLPGQAFSEMIHYNGMERIVSTVPSKDGGWVYLSVTPLEAYDSMQNQLQSFILALITIGTVSSLLISFLISVKVYQPIRTILSLLESGNTPIWDMNKNGEGPANEIKYIAATIVESNEQKKEMEEELRRRYEMMHKAQAVALQAQINPHMLYNTLEVINWKVMRLTNGKNEASTMIHTLSRLLRMSLSSGGNIIPLRTELEHARLYVEVQQLRFKDQLEVIWKINEGILDYPTVRLTIQPIIENAINHGIRPSGRPGLITVTGYEDTFAVVLKIKDNGVGLKPALTDKINHTFQSDDIKENEHIGLRNVNQRIKIIFGAEYGLRIQSMEGEGTIVEMRLPKLEYEG